MFEGALETAHLHGALVQQLHRSGCSFCAEERRPLLAIRFHINTPAPGGKGASHFPFSPLFNISSTVKCDQKPSDLAEAGAVAPPPPSSQGDLCVLVSVFNDIESLPKCSSIATIEPDNRRRTHARSWTQARLQWKRAGRVL